MLPALKPIMMRERVSLIFIEYGQIDVVDNAFVVIDKNGVRTHIPVGSVTCIMLEPGTRVSHAAAALAARVGTLLVWVGEAGVRLYASGQPGGARSDRLLYQRNWRWTIHRVSRSDRAMAARKTMSEGCSVLAGPGWTQRGNCPGVGEPTRDIVPSRARLRPAIPRLLRRRFCGQGDVGRRWLPAGVALAAWHQGSLARPVPVHSTRRRISPLVIPQQPHAPPCLTSSRVDPILCRVGGTAQRLGALRSPWPSSSMDAVPIVHPVIAWSTHVP
jgi:hypothetical protein